MGLIFFAFQICFAMPSGVFIKYNPALQTEIEFIIVCEDSSVVFGQVDTCIKIVTRNDLYMVTQIKGETITAEYIKHLQNKKSINLTPDYENPVCSEIQMKIFDGSLIFIYRNTESNNELLNKNKKFSNKFYRNNREYKRFWKQRKLLFNFTLISSKEIHTDDEILSAIENYLLNIGVKPFCRMEK